MFIIGLTGPIDSGKTCFANYLGAKFKNYSHLESSDLIIEVANALRTANQGQPFPSPTDGNAVNQWLSPLPQILKNITRVDVELASIQLTPEKISEDPNAYQKLAEYITLLNTQPELQTGFINVDNKDTHRALLQWLGGFMTTKINQKTWYRELMRRAHEEPLSDIVTVGGLRFPGDGECIKEKGGLIIKMSRPSMSEQDLGDITERERVQIPHDHLIINDGTLDQLRACAEKFSSDLQSNSLKPEYTASVF